VRSKSQGGATAFPRTISGKFSGWNKPEAKRAGDHQQGNVEIEQGCEEG